MLIKRIFGVRAPHFSSSGIAVSRMPRQVICQHLVALLHDCRDMGAQRVIFRINTARTPAELWLLRSDILQCISRMHSQTEAVARINSVVHVFEGWLPDSQLASI